jgi:hypothetical protein
MEDAGKSSVLNGLAEEKVAPTGEQMTTKRRIHYIFQRGERLNFKVILHTGDVTNYETADAAYEFLNEYQKDKEINLNEVITVVVSGPDMTPFDFMDSPGLNHKAKACGNNYERRVLPEEGGDPTDIIVVSSRSINAGGNNVFVNIPRNFTVVTMADIAADGGFLPQVLKVVEEDPNTYIVALGPHSSEGRTFDAEFWKEQMKDKTTRELLKRCEGRFGIDRLKAAINEREMKVFAQQDSDKLDQLVSDLREEANHMNRLCGTPNDVQIREVFCVLQRAMGEMLNKPVNLAALQEFTALGNKGWKFGDGAGMRSTLEQSPAAAVRAAPVWEEFIRKLKLKYEALTRGLVTSVKQAIVSSGQGIMPPGLKRVVLEAVLGLFDTMAEKALQDIKATIELNWKAHLLSDADDNKQLLTASKAELAKIMATTVIRDNARLAQRALVDVVTQLQQNMFTLQAAVEETIEKDTSIMDRPSVDDLQLVEGALHAAEALSTEHRDESDDNKNTCALM